MVEVSTHLPAPPQTVFDVISDPRTYPSWLVGAKRIRRVDPNFPADHSSFGHEVGAGPVTTEDETEVAHVEAGHRLDLVVHARPFLEAHATFVVDPDGDGSLLRLGEEPLGWCRRIRWLVVPLVVLRNRRSLRRLARLLDDRDGGRRGVSP